MDADTKLTLINIPRSDGDATKWPVLDGSDGRIVRVDDPNDQTLIFWKKSVADAVTKNNPRYGPNTQYILEKLPDGYGLYRHYRAQTNNRDGHGNGDPFLYGHPSIYGDLKFNSAKRFLPHAQWLMTDPTMDRSNCKCVLCVEDARRARNPRSSYGGGKIRPSARSTTSVSPAVSVTPSTASSTALSSEETHTISLATRKIPFVPPQPSTPTFREDDLVWVHLDVPVVCPAAHSEGVKIRFWPGIVLPDVFQSFLPPGSEVVDTFNVRLLRSGTRCIPANRLLPYDAWSGYESLQGNASIEKLEVHLLFEQPSPPWDTVIGPFLYALRLAEKITKYWSPMGDSDQLVSQGDSELKWLWWRAERLSPGDFVRLNVHGSDVELDGHPFQRPRKKPSRVLFLHLYKISATEQGDEATMELTISGALYELAGEGDEAVNAEEDDVSMSLEDADAKEDETGNQDAPMDVKKDENILVDVDADTDADMVIISMDDMDVVDVEQDELDDDVSTALDHTIVLSDTKAPPTSPSPSPSPSSSQPSWIPPPAPIGFTFRRLTLPDHEVIIPLRLIQGRYCPRLMEHPALANEPLNALGRVAELEGLVEGGLGLVPEMYAFSRGRMIEKAKREVEKELRLGRFDSQSV